MPRGKPSRTPAPAWRGHRRGLVAAGSIGGLVVVLAVVFTLAGWFGSPAGDSPGGSGASQAAGPTGTGSTGPGGSGAPGSGGHPSGTRSANPPGSSSSPTGSGTGPASTVLVGVGCPLDAGRSVGFTGTWDPQDGGWSDNGCDGGYRTHRTTSTGTDSVIWQAPTHTAKSCAVEVYVAIDGTAPAAFYNVISGSQINGFTLNQADNHGRWVPAGTFPVSPGTVSVRLSDRGDGKSVVAADAVRLTCR